MHTEEISRPQTASEAIGNGTVTIKNVKHVHCLSGTCDDIVNRRAFLNSAYCCTMNVAWAFSMQIQHLCRNVDTAPLYNMNSRVQALQADATSQNLQGLVHSASCDSFARGHRAILSRCKQADTHDYRCFKQHCHTVLQLPMLLISIPSACFLANHEVV